MNQNFSYQGNPSVQLHPRRSSLAFASMIVGLVSLPAAITCFGFIPGLVAVGLGIAGLVAIKKGAGQLTGGAFAWTGMTTGALATLASVALFAWTMKSGKNAEPAGIDPAKTAFRAAEGNLDIYGNSDTDTYSGNTEFAKELAQDYGETLDALEDQLFEWKEGAGPTAGDSEFVTHCHLGEDACVFLVRVPDYRRYAGDAKEMLTKAAWITVQRIASNYPGELPEGSKIGIGLRGRLLFGAVVTGSIDSNADAEFTNVIDYQGSDKYELLPFFELAQESTAPSPASAPEEIEFIDAVDAPGGAASGAK